MLLNLERNGQCPIGARPANAISVPETTLRTNPRPALPNPVSASEQLVHTLIEMEQAFRRLQQAHWMCSAMGRADRGCAAHGLARPGRSHRARLPVENRSST